MCNHDWIQIDGKFEEGYFFPNHIYCNLCQEVRKHESKGYGLDWNEVKDFKFSYDYLSGEQVQEILHRALVQDHIEMCSSMDGIFDLEREQMEEFLDPQEIAEMFDGHVVKFDSTELWISDDVLGTILETLKKNGKDVVYS